MALTGKELLLLRVAADVKGKDLAAAMGVGRSQVSRIENTRIVTAKTWDRYLAALDTCITKSNPEQAA